MHRSKLGEKGFVQLQKPSEAFQERHKPEERVSCPRNAGLKGDEVLAHHPRVSSLGMGGREVTEEEEFGECRLCYCSSTGFRCKDLGKVLATSLGLRFSLSNGINYPLHWQVP